MRIFRKHVGLTLLAVVLASMLYVVFGNTGTASAAPDYSYPDCCSGSTYISASKAGNGIYLDAPISYLKLKFSGDTYYHIIDILDACYWAGVDGGSSRPASCQAGHVTVTVCPGTPTGGFDIQYKNQGKCVNMDPASWGGGGQGTQSLWFRRAADPGGGTALDIQTAPDGFKYMYLIVGMNTAGGNGFKVTSHARTSSGANAAYTRVGFGATQGANMPMSLVNLPLNPVGTSTFELKFRVPCQSNTSAFNIGWFDADRGASGIPQDDTIDFRLINQSNGGQNLTAGQFAFFLSQSYEQYLGGNDESRSQAVGNSGIMRVQDTDLFTWRWENVRNNNGVQVLLPFDEPDADAQCPPPSTDVCPNLAGNQATVPPGYVKDPVTGNCNQPPPVFSCPRVPNINPRVPFDTTTTAPSPSGFYESTSDHDKDGVSGRYLYWVATKDHSQTSHQIQTINFAVGTGTTVTTPYTVPGTDYTHNDNSDQDHGILLNYTRAFQAYPYDTQLPTVTYRVTNVYNMQLWVDWYDDDQGSDGPANRAGNNYNQTVTESKSSTGPRLGPCHNRTYDALPLGPSTTPSGALSASLNPDQEESDTASFSFSMRINFAVEQQPPNPDRVAERSRLILPYQIQYYIDRWDSSGEVPTSDAKTTTIDATATTANSAVTVTDNHSVAAIIRDNAPNIRPGDRFCFRVRIPAPTVSPGGPTGGVGQMNVQGQNNASAGTIISGTTSQERFSNDNDPVRSQNGYTCTEIAVNRPYFRAYGGDVVAGSNFRANDSCVATGNAGIFSWNRTNRAANSNYSNTPNGGAGVQLAAYATGVINGFASAAGRGSAPTSMVGLTFANTSNPGGNWGTQYIGCMADYFAGRTGTVIASPSGYNGGTNGSFQGNGPFNFTGGNIPGGGVRRYTLYVNGDLAITGDVRLANTTFNGIAQIPSIRLIATGDIYIAPNVTELNAIIVSQGGTIYTCSRFDNIFSPPARDQITNPNYAPANTRCRNKLTINGALLASSIRFFRSNGSLRNSTNGEAANGANISEVINYSPEVWLGVPSDVPINDKPYDSYTGLPPVL